MRVAGVQRGTRRLHPLLQLLERPLRVAGEDAAGSGERGRTNASLEEREPEQLLERGDVSTDARLRQVERARRRAEPASLRYGEEAPQPRDLEEHRVAEARVGESPSRVRGLVALEVGRMIVGQLDVVGAGTGLSRVSHSVGSRMARLIRAVEVSPNNTTAQSPSRVRISIAGPTSRTARSRAGLGTG